MTRRRWIADEYDEGRRSAALLHDNAKHLARVLRARKGQEFDVACGSRVFAATITSVAEDRVEFALGAEVSGQAAARQVTAMLAVFKFDRFEWAVEKLTELGVAEIIPVIAQRTDAHLAAAAQKRVERWRRIVHEASQQSRRLASPEVAEPAKLKAAVAIENSAKKIVLWEGEQSVRLADLVRDDSAPLLLAIGPEGGWTDDEIALFRSAGWQTASLGARILRAETAAIAAMAIAMA